MRHLILIVVLFLGACGFEPMYGSSSGGASKMSAAQGLDSISIDIIPDAEGVELRNILIDKFYSSGYPANPRYKLSVQKLSESVVDSDITIESEATSRRIALYTSFSLIDLQTGQAALSRSLSAYASYNIIGSQFTTRVSEKDAREAAIADLARQIERQVALYFNR